MAAHPQTPPVRRALGVDPGDVRIGIALSDTLGLLAHPRETIPAAGRGAADPVRRIAEIVRRENVEVIVVGLPRNMDGTGGPAADKARALAEALRAGTSCEVRFVDERLTTVAAQRTLHDNGRNTRKSRGVIDQVAAQLILQTYLDGEAYRRSA